MFFFSVELIFSIFRGCWRWDNPHPLGDWKDVFFTFSPFLFLFVLFFMSGGDISLTHHGLIGAKTAELPQTLSRVPKLSFCQIERKMLSDRNDLELRKCGQSLSKMTINRQFTRRRLWYFHKPDIDVFSTGAWMTVFLSTSKPQMTKIFVDMIWFHYDCNWGLIKNVNCNLSCIWNLSKIINDRNIFFTFNFWAIA